jgi:hypothetical protein
VTPTPGWWYSPLDPNDAWLGEDKIAHFGWAAAVFAIAFAWGGATFAWSAVIVGSLAVEGLEVLRYQGWLKRGAPQPWPFLTDKASPKDVAVALLGAGLAQRLLPSILRVCG